MKTVNVKLTEDDLAVLYGALAEQHNRLLADKKDPAKQDVKQILERQYTRCLGALAMVQITIEKMYK